MRRQELNQLLSFHQKTYLKIELFLRMHENAALKNGEATGKRGECERKSNTAVDGGERPTNVTVAICSETCRANWPSTAQDRHVNRRA